MVTMYRAAKIAGVSNEAIRKQTKKMPPPLYFVKLKDNSYMVDEKNELFIFYCEQIQQKKMFIKPDTAAADFKKLITVTGAVLVRELGEDRADVIKAMIIKEVSGE